MRLKLHKWKLRTFFPAQSCARVDENFVTTTKVNLLDYDRQGLRDLFERLGEKPYRADQVMKWIYHRHVTDFSQMSDVGKALREKLEASVEIVPPNTLF